MKTCLTWIFVCAGALFAGLGCDQADNQRYFLLDVQREGKPQTSSQDVILVVHPFSLSPGYHAKELTYRTGDFQYESDYYNRFITDAGRQVAEQTRRWLAESGLFAQVVSPGTTMNATHLLEGNITRLYGDFRNQNNAQAVMSITFYYLDITERSPKILCSDTQEVAIAVPDNTVEALVAAYNAGLKQILTNLEARFRKELN